MLDFTPKRAHQPRSQGMSGKPVAMKLMESSLGRCPGPGVPLVNGGSGSASGSSTEGTAVYSAPTTDPTAGVMAISHQCPVVTKRGAQNVTTPGRSGEISIGLRS